MCLSLCVCACVKFNNYTRIIPKWLRFFFRTTRHSHDDVTMSIVLQSQNSFSVGRNSKSKRATCKEITKRLLFILLFSDAHDATTATRDRYKISIQILCMRIFDFLLLCSQWCAVLNRSHFTLQIYCWYSLRLCHFTWVGKMNKSLSLSISLLCPLLLNRLHFRSNFDVLSTVLLKSDIIWHCILSSD